MADHDNSVGAASSVGAVDALDDSQHKKRHFRLSIILFNILMCFGSLSFAYSGAVIGTTLGQPSFYEYMELDKMADESGVIGATTSMYYVGGFFGAFFSHWVGDRYGRRIAIFGGALIVLLSAALCAGSVHIAMFIVFRLWSGFGAIMLSTSVPLWIMECAPPEVRGAFAQMHAVGVNLGFVLANYVGVGFFLHVNTNGSWRGPQAIGCIPCIPLMIAIWWIPESPRYLLLKDRTEEAWSIIKRLHSTPNDTTHEFARREMYQMRKQLEIDRALPSSWLEMWRRPSYRKRMAMAIFLGFSIQACGSQIIAIYGTTLYKNLGFSSEKQLLFQAGTFAVNLPFTTSCVFYTEKFRRPTLISFGLVLLVGILSCYTGLTATYIGTDNRAGQSAAVAMIWIFLATYSATVEGPFYYYSSEFFPTHLRAKGMTLQATTFCWTSILWAQSAPTAIDNIGWHFFLIFIILATFGAAVIYFYYPDTRGKTLEEIAALFGDDDLVAVYQRDIHLDHGTVVADIVREKLDKEGTADNLEHAV
ncbi:hypothetical protein A1O3_02949 [Capronia epimyces CBS 606.96]|uniref:Major facilitator superfamily (MFS) profile domain-containing protein n=1 Tax=Capronia epimyces CBS 606.96 TaxID=1182542 RepID=W9YAN2_9EURO|nr:uncharacterized protein A1O3_02949 [Capronia epimyces CBS 606.96]EXJ89882.1 hypothetical protein A1O3_02949 [Capronia epimyces CBS 606.96]